MRWEAGCNTIGGEVEIRADSLVIGDTEGTEVGCSDALVEQDEWLSNFFGSDPRWRLRGDRLVLTSDDAVIKLRARS